VDKQYQSPTVTDYGDLSELTASNNIPAFVDVPIGTPVDPTDPSNGIVGNNLPDMS
jgi:hypothetical protein